METKFSDSMFQPILVLIEYILQLFCLYLFAVICSKYYQESNFFYNISGIFIIFQVSKLAVTESILFTFQIKNKSLSQIMAKAK